MTAVEASRGLDRTEFTSHVFSLPQRQVQAKAFETRLEQRIVEFPHNGDASSSTAVIHRDTEADPDAPRMGRPTQATHEIGTQANEEPSWSQRDLSTASGTSCCADF